MSRPTMPPGGDLAALTADLACAIARAGPLPEMLRRCADALARHLSAALVQIWVVNAAEDALILQAAAPDPAPPGALPAVPVGRSVPGRVVRDGCPVALDRVPADPALPDPGWVRRHGVQAFVGYPLSVDGGAVGAVGVLSRQPLGDLGPAAQLIAVGVERKRLADRLRQAEAFEVVGRTAAGLAHDLNNLMTLVTGYGDLVRPLLPPGTAAAGLTADLGQVATRAAAVARRLVALGRPTPAAVVDLNAAVTDAVPLARRVIGPGAELAVRLDSDAGRVRIDPRELEQVIVNLVANARDAMPHGGAVTIRTSRPPAAAGRDPPAGRGPEVRLTVADTGAGIDAATRARLFEPYFTTKPPGRGTGLGLTTVKSVVSRAGGRVSVESEPGRGTAVHVDLQRVEDTAVSGSTDGPGEPTDGSPTILVAEDDAAVRALIRHVLGRGRYTVLEAADGPAALRAAEAHVGPIHLLISDLLMPGMTGRQLADRLTAVRPGLKVLYLSGLGADVAAASHPGAAFLDKPFRPADLAQLVTELIGA